MRRHADGAEMIKRACGNLPGTAREHDTTCARTHPELLPALDAWINSDHAALGDLGYEGENRA